MHFAIFVDSVKLFTLLSLIFMSFRRYIFLYLYSALRSSLNIMKLSLVLVILLWLQEPIITSPVTSDCQFGGGGANRWCWRRDVRIQRWDSPERMTECVSHCEWNYCGVTRVSSNDSAGIPGFFHPWIYCKHYQLITCFRDSCAKCLRWAHWKWLLLSIDRLETTTIRGNGAFRRTLVRAGETRWFVSDHYFVIICVFDNCALCVVNLWQYFGLNWIRFCW